MLIRYLLATCLASLLAAGGALADEPNSSAPPGPYTLDQDSYPIAMFSVPNTDEDFRRAREMGIGYVHTYGLGGDSSEKGLADADAYLDQAQRHGLKVMFNLRGRNWIPHGQAGLEGMQAVVDHVKNHPALGFWYLVDEPDGRFTPEQILPFYQMLKRQTPDIPVTAAIHWSENWTKFGAIYDVILNDIYPVYNSPFPKADLQYVTNFTDSALDLGKPAMPILQSFNWAAMAKPGAEKVRGRAIDSLRYPTREELRYWNFSTLIQGARGVIYWSYARGMQVDPQWMTGPFAEAVRELRDFTSLVAPAHRMHEFERARDGDLFLAMWRREAGDFLVLVNAWPTEKQVRYNVAPQLRDAQLAPWGLTRSSDATIKDGRLAVNIQPWEVLIWRVDSND